MESWALEVFQIYSNSKINKSNFNDMIKEAKGKIFLRQGIIEFFKLIENYNIYLIIISAGIYESINTILKHLIPNFSSLQQKNLIKIMGNKFQFDKENNIINIEYPIIQTFNKSTFFKNELGSSDKTHVILIGDHLNDSDITNEVHFKEYLKFGFFNYPEGEKQELLENYKKRYDLIIQNNGNFNHINDHISNIYNNK